MNEKDFSNLDFDADQEDSAQDDAELDDFGVDFRISSGSLLETNIAGSALLTVEVAVSSSEMAARTRMNVAISGLIASTQEITRLLKDEATEVVNLLEETEAASSDYNRTPTDQKVIDKALEVSKKMVDVLVLPCSLILHFS